MTLPAESVHALGGVVHCSRTSALRRLAVERTRCTTGGAAAPAKDDNIFESMGGGTAKRGVPIVLSLGLISIFAAVVLSFFPLDDPAENDESV